MQITYPQQASQKYGGAIAKITPTLFLLNYEDALYFAWTMDRWFSSRFVNGKPNNSFAYSWKLVDGTDTASNWTLKFSTNEPCYNVQFGMPQHTYTDFILAEVNVGSKMKVHCKAGVGNIKYFAQQLVPLSAIVMSAIKDGLFDEVAVPILESDYHDENIPVCVRQRLLELKTIRRKGKIDYIDSLLAKS